MEETKITANLENLFNKIIIKDYLEQCDSNKEWYENGSKRVSGQYVKGKKNGTWYHWNSWCIQMEHSSPVIWKNGNKISEGKKKKK